MEDFVRDLQNVTDKELQEARRLIRKYSHLAHLNLCKKIGGVLNFMTQSKFSSFKPATDIDFKKYTQITQTVSHPNDFLYKATIYRTLQKK